MIKFVFVNSYNVYNVFHLTFRRNLRVLKERTVLEMNTRKNRGLGEAREPMEDAWKAAWPCSRVLRPCSRGRSHARPDCRDARPCM